MDLRWIWSGSGVDLGVALEVWPGYAPVWSGYAPVWGLCRDLLEKSHFFVKIIFFDNFSFRALKLLANHEKQLLTFFGFLPPYFDVSRSLVQFM